MGKTIFNFGRKVSLILCLVFVICPGLFAQSGITVHFKDTPLKVVLGSISDQSKYKFVYTDELNVDGYTITVDSDNESAPALFNKIFKPLNISYAIKGNQVVLGIIKQNAVSRPSGQTQVTGTVVESETGEPLPGVTVQNVTKNTVVSADLDGKYSINAAAGDKLKFSSIGMADYETIVGKSDLLNVAMNPDAIALSDVVVTGYQTLSKERATGSYAIIKSEQLEKPTSNIASRIVGTTAGVQATTDENGDVSFEIRGQTSLYANAQPLVVVDGFPIQGGFSSINPNDVESVTILKDAAAASIWGAKSANGVIIVVTKKGSKNKKGDVRVDVSSFWKYSPKLDLDYMNPLASSAETVDYERRGFTPQGFFGSTWLPNEDNYRDYSAHSLAVTALNENRLGYLSDSEMEAILQKLSVMDNRKQIKDYILDNPFTQQYNINISGSTERADHMLSLLFEDGNNNYQGNRRSRYNISYRTNVKVFKWLDFSFGGNFYMTQAKNNEVPWSGSPYQMLINEDGSRADVSTYYKPNIQRHVPTSLFPYDDWSYNPITERENRDYRTKTINYRAQAGLTAKIIEGLTLDSKIQYEQILTDVKNIDSENTFRVRNTINTASTWDMDNNKVTANLPKGGFLEQNKNTKDAYNWRNQVNFNRGFNDNKHQISFIAGTEISSIVYQTTTSPRTYGYNDDKLTVGQFPNGVGGSGAYKLTNWQGNNQTFAYTHQYTYTTERYFSLYANASYTFDGKYTVSGSARTDASNLITDDPKYRYAPFWSVGASWALSEESFMKGAAWLDRLAVRLTYGYNGNVDRSTSFQPLINVGTTQDIFIQDYTASVSSYGNPELRWEKTGSFDFGVDFSMFNGKLYGKLDVYNKKGKDLIVSMSIPSINGTKTQKLNAAEMTNRGIEFELGSSLNIYGNKITWTGGFNFSYNYNNIDNLFKSTYNAYDLYGGGTAAYVEGYNANTLWSFKYAGVVNKGTEANPNWQPVVQGAGSDLYDFTGWTPGDGRDYMLNMGTKVAPYVVGFTSSFRIFDFDLSFILTGKFGHKFNGFYFNYPSMSGGSGLPNKLYAEILNSSPDERVPIPFGKSEDRYYFWDRFFPYLDYNVQGAGHVRLQELNITYNVPRSFLKKIGIRSARIYAQGNNLLTIKNNKYKEDPEFGLGTLKPQAAYTFGINLTF